MAVAKFFDATVTLGGTGGPPPTGGTALPHVRAVTLNYSANLLDITEMGNGTMVNLAGILEWSMDVTVLQDYAAANVDAILFPYVGAAAFYIQLKPTSGAVSTSNPEYYGLAVLGEYNPVDGSHGDAQEISVSFSCAGALTRRTS
jgi:hypothetical protein